MNMNVLAYPSEEMPLISEFVNSIQTDRLIQSEPNQLLVAIFFHLIGLSKVGVLYEPHFFHNNVQIRVTIELYSFLSFIRSSLKCTDRNRQRGRGQGEE